MKFNLFSRVKVGLFSGSVVESVDAVNPLQHTEGFSPLKEGSEGDGGGISRTKECEGTPIFSSGAGETGVDVGRDDAQLSTLGYKQELTRGMSGFMSFAFTLTAVGVLPSICTAWGNSLVTGGPSVILYGWIVCGVFTTITGCALAELNARYPSAGSVYTWTAMLAPRRYAPLASYICGVFNFAGNAAGDAAFAYGFANFVSGLKAAGEGGESLSPGGVVGVAMTVSVVWAAINALRIDTIGWVNNVAALWQCVATVVIICTVLAGVGVGGGQQGLPSDWPWTTPYATNGLDNGAQVSPYIALVGLLNALFAFSGYEAGTHMAEETKDASASSSWGILQCCGVTAGTGFLLNLGLLYATPRSVGIGYLDWVAMGGLNASLAMDGDPSALVAPGDTSTGAFLRYALGLTAEGGAIGLFFSCAGTSGGAFLSLALLVSSFFTGVASLTATSRMCYAMARDGALPCAGFLTRISPSTGTPLGTVLLTLLLDCALLLLGLVEEGAGLSAVLSITVIGLQISYAIPLFLRLFPARNTFQAHPAFHLKHWSLPIHACGAAWLAFTSIILFWPTAAPVRGDNFNYTVVVVAAVGILGMGWWWWDASVHYKGPREEGGALVMEKLEVVGPAPAGGDQPGPCSEYEQQQ